ncbi:hypothetical protein SIN8267_00617 [Sinobacterium norvegicum]|uniref:Uncharacterized protein n=1 Tax=Sinobacterium norvegicum TaxID=1641715 RepID=A0ABN8EH65_9GAMM|nr:hypothetical protein [Sinobacterium norvegicum]CAH0990525.1 hypothetical protein SIN8267_00617 [Sinobacterium norvegicum]
MSDFVEHSLTPEKLLALGNNLIYKAFLEASRVQAKRLYAGLLEGKTAFIVTVKMEDGTELKVDVKMYREHYQGKLNFSIFKKQLELLVARIDQRLKSAAPDRVNMRSDSEGANHLFNIPAMMQDGERLNILMLGMSTQAPGRILYSLNYLDPKAQGIKPQE